MGLGGAAAFREVRVQSVVVEFLLTHVEVLFSDTFTSAGLDPAGMSSPSAGVLATALQCQALSGLQWEGRWAPGPTLTPLTRPHPSSLRTPPWPIPPRAPSFSFQLLRPGSPLLGQDAVLPSPLIAPLGVLGSTWEEVGGPQT